MFQRQFWTEGPGSFVIAVVLALFIRWALFEAYVIPSPSMLPTLLVNDHIFVNKIVYGLRWPFTEKWIFEANEPERGEVVVFKHQLNPKLFFIKRIVGLPGDKIFYENGNLYVNDVLVEKSIPVQNRDDSDWISDADFLGERHIGGKDNYVHWEETLGDKKFSVLLRKSERSMLSFGPYTVPPKHYFMMGDNRDNSEDSRGWDPQASRASGVVRFQRKDSLTTPKVQIPAGTLVKTDLPSGWSQSFKTQRDVVLEGDSIEVEVKALESGLMSNAKPETVVVIEGALKDQLSVTNPAEFTGGDDKRFVHRDLLIGRASQVWLSCEKKLPFAQSLCHPLKIRWKRVFHTIH